MNSSAPSLRRLLATVLLILAGTAVTVDAYIQSRRPDAFGVVQWGPPAALIELQPEGDELEVEICPLKCGVQAEPAITHAS
jgi:hypothetical protein